MSDYNDWDVPYSVISFFVRALEGHAKVARFTRTRDILFSIVRENGTTMNVLLVNEYCLGLAAVLRARAEFPEADYIVTGGSWNGYTPEAKEYGRENAVGIFNIAEFFGALYWSEPKTYYKKDQDGNPVYAYKNP